MTRIPYLRVPVYRDGSSLRYPHAELSDLADLELRLVDLVFEAGHSLDDLADVVIESGIASDRETASRVLESAFSKPGSPIALVDVDVAQDYDVICVEQGYGGVFVHSVELVKHLQRRGHRCLLLSPVDPLFDDDGVTDVVSLERLREQDESLSYFSYVHILRSIVKLASTKLLLIAHRSQSLYLFDLIQRHPTIIYCDGYFDGHFRMSMEFGFPEDDAARRRTLSEIYYLLANGQPEFFGILTMPLINRFLLMAGCRALTTAKENWCWGARQTNDFRGAFPNLPSPVEFHPPFMDASLFRPEIVEREPYVLFTTTMHNIEKKGFPELVRAMQEIEDLRVRCVVRQPECLPEYPEELVPRFDMGGVPKSEMIEIYHRCWLNCRVSREESSPVSILEAMICEVPQVTSPAVAEQIPLIEDGATGFVVDPDDTDGLVRALRQLMADRELRDRMGAEARRRALEYTFEARKESLEKYL